MNLIYQAALMEVANRLDDASALAVVIDPPYGYAQTKSMKVKGIENPKWDTVGNARRMLQDSVAVAGRILHDDGIVFVFSPYERLPQTIRALEDAGLVLGGVAVWDKTQSRPRFVGFSNSVEFIVWGHNIGAKPRPMSDGLVYSVCRKTCVMPDKWHPTPKPVDVMSWILKAAHDGLVVDLCAGTCSTAQAAHILGRPWVMIEREADYVARASAELSAAGAVHEVVNANEAKGK